ncbi:thiamine phosphate synthase [Bacillus sp. 31A1R]|uniref:Thiamine-phosphate synthase n=1 Tax=Robertmurraya mangrovi TaxID=3098077 RepID=A0ABU5J3G0_9BACI|nr:thiamine phosphate synthase [Bacillus sp. 31A1R]MDZ5473906.1 thiamine phosphate synthase [Bacillus sp. 31A1R]
MTAEQLRFHLKLYFIMGSTNCNRNPLDVLKEAIDGGITFFQYREKGEGALKDEQKLNLALQLQKLCKKVNIPFIVNDDIDLAIAINADGVHIGQEDEPVEMVRKKIGNMILGVSVHNHEEAIMAMNAGADYFGIGPIFPTQTKTDAKPVQGVSLIKELRDKGISIPIVGIGGIHAENAHTVMEAGGDGVSVISAISLAPSVKEAARSIRKSVDTNHSPIS